jgi:hypothetical protein
VIDGVSDGVMLGVIDGVSDGVMLGEIVLDGVVVGVAEADDDASGVPTPAAAGNDSTG